MASEYQEQGRPSGLPLLHLKELTKLTDAAMYAFNVLCDLERRQKAARKAKLAQLLAEFDPFAPELNHEDYIPEGDQG
jgi:hypothetical protein